MQIKEFIIGLKNNFRGYHLLKNVLTPIIKLYSWVNLLVVSLFHILLSLYCYKTLKVYGCNHLTIGIWKLYKKRTQFPHPVGIVIGMKVSIGFDCIIYQNVTIGTKDTINYKTSNYPIIGNNVTIFPNAAVIGDITIGDNAIIGAGAIVLSDVPCNKIAVGNPARIK